MVFFFADILIFILIFNLIICMIKIKNKLFDKLKKNI